MLSAIGHHVSTCCDVLRHVGCCWLKFENGQIFHATFVNVAWCCSRLARFVQQCCATACALVRFSIRNMSQHVATGWSNTCNMLRATMLRSVVFKCCDRLAGDCKCWANNVGICCVEMLLSFGRGFIGVAQVFASVRNSHRTWLWTRRRKTNADLRFLMNKICKHGHRHYISIIQIFEPLQSF